jgi:hypothetical protein
MGRSELRRELGLSDLVLFICSFIAAPRWIAAAAHAGPGAVTLWIGATLLFAFLLGIAVAFSPILQRSTQIVFELRLFLRSSFWHVCRRVPPRPFPSARRLR